MIDFKPATFELQYRALLAEANPEIDFVLDDIDDALQEATLASFDARACAYLAADNLRRQPFCYGAYQTYTLL